MCPLFTREPINWACFCLFAWKTEFGFIFYLSTLGHKRINTPTDSSLFFFTGAIISKEATATISAKPQLRNTQAELTKLVPTALRIKRDQPKNKAKLRPPGAGPETVESIPQQVSQPRVAETGTKDDAYAIFMKEMQGLL